MIKNGTESAAPIHDPVTVRCRIAAWSVISADVATIVQWRRAPGIVAGQALPPSFLRQSEDQTVVAMRAVLDAIERHDLRDSMWTDWGILAGPTFMGRTVIAQTIQRYKAEGAWCVSPHFIPHQSLHAVSGTISQALKIHGPNFGVGGGANSGPDALLSAVAMIVSVPGLWLVLTGHDAESIPTIDGAAVAAPRCQAVALALTQSDADAVDLGLSFGQAQRAEASRCLPEFQLADFAEALPKGVGRWCLSDSLWVQLDSAGSRPEALP